MCADGLAELLDPADRRYRYPFINAISLGQAVVAGARDRAG